MKKEYIVFIFATILSFCCTISTVSANNIYLSVAEGLDTNDGSTPELAVKTICKAMTVAALNDTIKIAGMVNLDYEPQQSESNRDNVKLDGTSVLEKDGVTYNVWMPNVTGRGLVGLYVLSKNLTFEGLDKTTCGFDANNHSTIFRIDGLVGSVTFKNLTFTGGNNAPFGDNGAGLYLRSTGAMVFENCNFTGNKNPNPSAADQGGAVVINTGAPVFRSCYFADNSNKKGAAIAIGVGSLVLDSCIIEDHDTYAISGSQGALFISANQPVNITVTATVFKNNKALQGGAFYVEDQDNATTEVNALFKSCAFISNESNSGGAAFINNRNTKDKKVNVTFVNTTFYANKLAATYGASVATINSGKAGCNVNFTNCTVTKNTAPFAQGTAFRFQSNAAAMQKSFYNCLVEDNTGLGDTDIHLESATANANFTIKNSFFGRLNTTNFPAGSYPGNTFNYFTSGVSRSSFKQPVEDFILAQHGLPVRSTAPAAAYGNADYLRDSLNIVTDQLGAVRAFADNKCTIGSVEITEPAGVSAIFLSVANGSDTNDGLTSETAVKTICKAMTLAATGDVIKIDGMISLDDEPQRAESNRNVINLNGTSSWIKENITYNVWIPIVANGARPAAPIGLYVLAKNLTFEGLDKTTCGFDAKGHSSIFRIDGVVGSATFKNLTFTGGNNAPFGDSGSGLYIRTTSPINFENCRFVDNKNLDTSVGGDGGAVLVNNAAVSFKSCYFAGNSNVKGSAIMLTGGDLSVDSCLIENQDVSTLNSSGTIFIRANIAVNNVTVKSTIFKNNKTKYAGGAVFFDDVANNRINATFQSCAFIGNSAVLNPGGAVGVSNKSNNAILDLGFVNSTFYGNTAANQGGAVYVQNGKPGSKINFTNCTITRNTSSTAALHFAETASESTVDIQKGIYNCLIEDNPKAGTVSDIVWAVNGDKDASANLEIKNSFIGASSLTSNDINTRFLGNQINYYASQSSKAGFIQPIGSYVDSLGCIPLLSSSEAFDYGDAVYLRDSLNILVDQLGTTRAFTNNKCAIGAIETLLESGTYLDKYLHFFMYGQSHSVASQSYPPLSVENVEGNYMTGIQVWNGSGNEAADKNNFNPLISRIPYNGRNSERNKNLAGEPALIGAINHIQLKTKGTDAESKMLATVCGQGGLTIEQLSKNGPSQFHHVYEGDFLPAVNFAFNAAQRSRIQLYCPAIFWLQGESNQNEANPNNPADEERNTTKAGYKSLLLQLKNDMQTDIMTKYGQDEKPVFITYQMSGAFITGPKELNISMAHVEAADENEDIICAGPVYPVTYHTSGSHYDANGYRWYGEMFGKVYYKTQVLKEDFKPLQPKTFYGDAGNPKQLRIKFAVPVLPLVLDDKLVENKGDYGFEVYKNSTKKTIANVAVDNSDCVLITLSENIAPTDEIEIIYAGVAKKFGNLRDSDPYQALYEYEDLDKQDNGSYIYPRGLDPQGDPVTTLRPTYEPKDQSGNVIYGQKYPLYNFSVAFYKKIAAGELQYNYDTALGKSTIAPKINVYLSGSDLIVDAGNNAVQKVEIFNLSGSAVKLFGAQHSASYSLTGLSHGIYVAKVTTQSGAAVVKIIN